MIEWRVRRGEKTRGPFTEPEMFELIGKRQIRAGDQVDADGAENWWPIEHVPTFSASFQAPAPIQHVAHYYPVPAYQAAAPVAFVCRSCGSAAGTILKSKMTSNGRVAFWLSLLFCFPLFWIGLSMTENVAFCRRCNCRV